MPQLNRNALLVAFYVLTALGCSKRAPGDEELGARIAAAAQSGDVAVVDVPAIASFGWERLFIFPPYTPAAQVQQALGFTWAEAARIAKRDDVVLLVFVANGQVVRFVDLPRSGADFAEASRPSGFSHSEALFRCRRDQQDQKDKKGGRRCALAGPHNFP